MKKNLSLWMLGIAVMLASCSQNEELLQGTNKNDGLVHITAQLEDGMKTRAGSENNGINRYVLEVYTVATDGTETKNEDLSTINETGSFDLQLDRDKNYRFYCWADEGTASAYDVSNGLEDITLKEGANPTIAHRGVSSADVPGTTTEPVTIQMTHAVAKVVLNTTGNLGAGEARVETETYTQYNAIRNVYTTKATDKVGETGPETAVTVTEGTTVEALSFYILTGKETQAVDLKYTPTGGTTYTKTLDNVPFEADCRTILTGDLEGLWFNTASITAVLDNDWTDENKLNANGYTIELTEGTTLTPEMLTAALGNGNTVAVTGDMNQASMEAVFSWLKGEGTASAMLLAEGINVDLSNATATDFDFIGDIIYNVTDISCIRSLSNAKNKKTLRSISFPKGIKEIGRDAFNRYAGLTSVTLPQGLEQVTDWAFYETGITEIDLPATVTTINLQHTTSLKTVRIRATLPHLGKVDFSENPNLTDVYFYGNTQPLSFDKYSFCFYGLDRSKITIHIPATASIEEWKTVYPEWSDFKFEYIKE